ncbi:MAG: hypothetical protein K8R64_07075 [Methanosarcinaceae archaeon]|nr:hypothetical protein [Methanosarcinaceae archaeon]
MRRRQHHANDGKREDECGCGRNFVRTLSGVCVGGGGATLVVLVSDIWDGGGELAVDYGFMFSANTDMFERPPLHFT